MLVENFFYSVDSLCKNALPKKVAVAVSGGADSMALLHLTKLWAADKKVEMIALTVDHNFRNESKDEAQTVAKWARNLAVPHHILTHAGSKPDANIMEEARKIRYGLLEEYCKHNNITHLLIAHHADDQIETFLMRLERGSGVDGLCAMEMLSTFNGINIMRPLLNVNKNELISYLEENSIDWIEDPTNDNTYYKRNKLRSLLWRFSGEEENIVTSRILNTAKSMQRVKEALEHFTQQAATSCVTLHDQGYITLNITEFMSVPEEIQLRLLKECLLSVGNRDEIPRMEKLLNLHGKIIEDDFTGATLHGGKIESHKNNVIFVRERSCLANEKEIIEKTVWDNRFAIRLDKNLGQCLAASLSENNLKSLDNFQYPTTFPKSVLYSLPIIKKISSDGVENILSIPHINYYTEQCPKEAIDCDFLPSKLLAAI